MNYFIIISSLVILIIRLCEGVFELPSSYLGLWNGNPDFNILGPFQSHSYTMGIGQAPNGDYLLENNIVYDGEMIGYQRFYLEGSGDTAGNLWYCGSVSNFSDATELTGLYRLNKFIPLKPPENEEDIITFCLDSENPLVMDGLSNPFKLGCSGCDCANWTLSYNADEDTLISQMSMSGSEGHTHSKHMWSTLTRVGPAPKVSDEDMPGHGSDFTCDFDDGGRDAEPVSFYGLRGAKDSKQSDAAVDNQKATEETPATKQHRSMGCPAARRHFNGQKPVGSMLMNSLPEGHEQWIKEAQAEIESRHSLTSLQEGTNSSDYNHCYILNGATGFQLQWTLDEEKQLLHCAVSAPVLENGDGTLNLDNTYVAIGFRPLSRAPGSDMEAAAEGTGRHSNFGMQGADIVVGSMKSGVRQLYADLYTGPPVMDDSLELIDATVTLEDAGVYDKKLVKLSFTRPLVSGYLATNYNSDASITAEEADIMWAIGLDSADDSSTGGNIEYHHNNRGLRVIDWANPEIAMVDNWKCY